MTTNVAGINPVKTVKPMVVKCVPIANAAAPAAHALKAIVIAKQPEAA